MDNDADKKSHNWKQGSLHYRDLLEHFHGEIPSGHIGKLLSQIPEATGYRLIKKPHLTCLQGGLALVDDSNLPSIQTTKK